MASAGRFRQDQPGGVADRRDHCDKIRGGNVGRGRHVRPFGSQIDGGGDAVDLFSLAWFSLAWTRAAQVMPPMTSSTSVASRRR
jgi:hypothetical protein